MISSLETTGQSFTKTLTTKRLPGFDNLVKTFSVLPQFDNEIVRIAEEIERYLLTHPYAADSFQGVVKWWFLSQRYQEASSLVQKALDFLVAQGRVVKIKNTDGTYIYKKTLDDKGRLLKH